MFLWPIAISALYSPAPSLPQTSEPDLKMIPLTVAQKAMFEALSKAGYKRTSVHPSDKEAERYVRLQIPGALTGAASVCLRLQRTDHVRSRYRLRNERSWSRRALPEAGEEQVSQHRDRGRRC